MMPDAAQLAVIQSIDAPARTATVRLAGGIPTLLSAVPIAAHIDAAGLTTGRRCLIAFREPHNPDSAVIYAVLGTPADTPGGGGGGSGFPNAADIWIQLPRS